ncbi:MAG: cobaltochelatase subunit CobN [Euryarchaeota archaeon]|nr:cobaltochelatase subunit CobN [Euryarchaeota archaeon]
MLNNSNRIIAVLAITILILAITGTTPALANSGQHVDIAIVTGYTSYQIPLENVTTEINGNASLNITASYYLSELVLMGNINLSEMDVIYINMISAPTALKIESTINDAIANGAVVLDDNTLLNESIPATHDPATVRAVPDTYWANAAYNETNIENLIFYLACEFCNRTDLVVGDPIELPTKAIYHPEMPGGFCEDLDEYLAWYGNRTDSGHIYGAKRPTVGIAFYASYYPFKIEPVDILVEEFESHDFNVIPFYSTTGKERCDCYLKPDADREPIVDAIVSFTYFSLKFDPGEIGVPVINAVINNYMNRTEWEESSRPLPTTKMMKIDYPELVGAIDPIVMAATETDPETGVQQTLSIDYQVNWLVNRTIAQINLGEKEDADKKVVIIYYNHGGGKDNIGASYLDVAPSLCNLLDDMSAADYDVNMSLVPNKTALIDTMLSQGINVGSWAPGVLNRMVETGKVELIQKTTYEEWFMELPIERRDEVLERWGPVPGEIMVWENETGEYLVIPKIDLGDNVMLAPQPTRGWLQNNEALYHDKELAPHHQYLAFYFWLHKEYQADAIVHFGRHGTQEWLPGKQFGLSRYDWPSIMVGDMPVVYPYVMDGLGEGNQAKRRGSAVIVDHLVPPIIAAGLYGNYTELADEMLAYERQDANPTLKAAHRAEVINLTTKLHLDEQLEIDLTPFAANLTANQTEFEDDFLEPLEHLLDDLRSTSMPYGLHILGTSPHGDKLTGMINSILGQSYADDVCAFNDSEDAPLLLLDLVINQGAPVYDAQIAVMGTNSTSVEVHLENALIYARNLAEGDNEVIAVLDALDGKFIPPNLGGDPVRTPDALPTGRNFYAFDQRRPPTEAAWELGKDMVNQTLEMHLAAHEGAYPKKMAYILWAGETTRHEGVMEAQILYLLGVEPVWSKGKVVGVSAIPSESMSRPRIDVLIVVSGLYRDMFPDKIVLLDRAVRLAYEQNETADCPNYVAENTDALAAALIANDPSLNESDARNLALMRIFGCSDGTYGTGLANAIGASNTWNNTDVLAQLFIDRMGNAYGADVWGETATNLFAMNLADVEVTMHSRSSNLYGAIDNDDFFQYLGGLNLAVTYASGGNTPDSYVTNLRATGGEKVETLGDFISGELYSRYFNPTWIEGMQEHDYAGAREFADFVENLWGWQVTCPELIPDHVWDQVYETYVTNNALRDWIEQNNPHAYQSMTARMLEAVRKGYWDATDEVIKSLVAEYMESVAENGATCCHHTCGNPLLDDYISGIISAPDSDVVSSETASEYRETMDEVTGRASALSQPADTDTGSSGGGDGTYPPGWFNDADETEDTVQQTRSATSATNETVREGGVGVDVNQPAESVTEPEPAEPSDYVEGPEMEVERSSELKTGLSFSGAPMIGLILMIGLAAVIYWGYRRRG